MKKGFTLAETLLTLVILGVVAAMTLPSVFSDTKQTEWEAQRLKAISTVANGYKKMMSIYGVSSIDNLPMWTCTTKKCMSDEHKLVFSIISDSLSDNILTAWNPEPLYGAAYALTYEQDYIVHGTSSNLEVSWGDLDYVFVTTDGMIFGLTNMDTENNLYFDVLVDTNGGRKPNKVGKDYFEFQMTNSGEVMNVTDDAILHLGGNTSNNIDVDYTEKKNKNRDKNKNRGKGKNNGNNNPNKEPGNNSGNGNGNGNNNPNKGPGNNSGNGNNK